MDTSVNVKINSNSIRTLKMSDKTLSKKIDYNGFYFKEIGEKLKC